MMQNRFVRLARPVVLVIPVLIAAACGGSDCATCPGSLGEGALRMSIRYDDAARVGVEPAGFRLVDVRRLDIVITGPSGSEQLSLPPAQDGAFVTLTPGVYQISAEAFGVNEVLLFTATAAATVLRGDTVDVALRMDPNLGPVTLTVDDRTEGTVEAVAGTGVPFLVRVHNGQGQPVPGATVSLTTSVPGYAEVVFDGENQTDFQGRATGVIHAPHSGSTTLSLVVDGRPIPDAGPTGIEFATGVEAARSLIVDFEKTERPAPGHPLANGLDRYGITVVVRNKKGEPLPRVPVTPVSSRNEGLDIVDIVEPAPGFESGTTDELGRYKFFVRTFSSSFLQLDEDGHLSSEIGSGTRFFPSTLLILADGVQIDLSSLVFNSTVNPNAISLTPTKQFVTADGQDSVVLVVEATQVGMFGNGPARNAYVEIVDTHQNLLNFTLDIVPEPGYEGFRTNAQGEWRGRLRSKEADAIFLFVKVDGRTVVPWTPDLVIFN